MTTEELISDHYEQHELVSAIERGFSKMGKATDDLTIEDLAVVDEFHTGGRVATEGLMSRLGLTAEMAVLDVGCGLGGAARFCAERFGSQVTGIDLTPSYITAAKALTEWVELGDKVEFQVSAAQSLPFTEPTFDASYLLHVGMNVPDKPALFAGIANALKPGGRLAVYDLMRVGAGELTFPVPWASTAETSYVESPESYEAALASAGLELTMRTDQTDLAKAFMAQIRKASAGEGGPPPVGLHLLMGRNVGEKVGHLIEALDTGILAPIEIIATRP